MQLPLTAFFLFSIFMVYAQTPQRTEYCNLPVYFDFGADTLNTEARSRLQQLAGDIRGLPELDIRLTAHTDAVGSSDANLELSERRAEAVSRVLISAGLPDSLIRRVPQGEGTPVASNATEEGRRQNRRVEVAAFSTLAMRNLSGQITDQESGRGVPATVLLSTSAWADSLQTDTTGRFEARVPAQQRVRIDAFAQGFFFDTKIIEPDSTAAAVSTTLPLPPAQKGAKLPIKRLHFVGGRAVLRVKSIPELDRLLRFLQINKKLAISIHGHVNVPSQPPVAKDSDHYKLSEARAQHVYNYLVDHGIGSERLSWEAHGNWEMLYPKATTLGQQAANRRVEIEVE